MKIGDSQYLKLVNHINDMTFTDIHVTYDDSQLVSNLIIGPLFEVLNNSIYIPIEGLTEFFIFKQYYVPRKI